jgi:uracil-DNA glycosylase
MKRPFKFTMKQWHNIILMTLIQNPIIILCIHKPNPLKYDQSQYLPFELWDDCLYHYIHYLTSNHIRYIIYDYMAKGTSYLEYLLNLNRRNNAEIEWWQDDWEAGYGCTGSAHPKFLLVAERIGPNNTHNIPFEAGPTGQMLTDMLSNTGTPLGTIAITNMVKSFRGDKRPVNVDDITLLEEEITLLKPEKVIFMGTPAKRGVPLAKSLGCDVGTMVHLGALNHKGIKDMSGYHNEWKKMLGMLPVVSYKEV